MGKRDFRRGTAAPADAPSYPTLEQGHRRGLLARIGATLLAAGAAATIAGCDGRSAPDLSDGAQLSDGGADTIQRADLKPDHRYPPPLGAPMMPDAGIDGS